MPCNQSWKYSSTITRCYWLKKNNQQKQQQTIFAQLGALPNWVLSILFWLSPLLNGPTYNGPTYMLNDMPVFKCHVQAEPRCKVPERMEL